MKTKIKIRIKGKDFFIPPILLLVGGALLVRLIFVWFGTLRLDQGTFIAWSKNLAENGLRNFYKGWSDYFPGYLYLLWFLGKIRGILPDVLLYKLPAIISDLTTGYLIYKIIFRLKNERWGLIGAGIYLFNPAILGNSTLWGQVDSLTSFFSLLSIYLFTLSPPLSSVSLAVGTLIKPQATFILPVIFFLFLKEKKPVKEIFIYGLTGLAVFVLGFVPFNNSGNLFSFIIERIQISSSQYPYSSVNAFNFWGLGGFWNTDLTKFPLLWIGLAITVAITVTVVLKAFKNKFNETKEFSYFLVGEIFLTSFLFLTRMHERHLLPALAPLAIIASLTPVLMLPYFSLSLTYVANLAYSYHWITYGFKEIFSPLLIKVFIVVNLFSLGFLIFSLFKKINLKKLKLDLPKTAGPVCWPKLGLTSKTQRLILVAILAFAFITRTLSLGSPVKEYFDEVYHAFTAKLILHNDPKAWEWWNPHPEGFAYEWTHPPLAKLGMVLGMSLFGENAFGWRIIQALLGVGAVYLVYLLGKHLFKDEGMGLISAGVFSLDGLALVMSRIGMNDSYLLFFMLLSLYLFIKEKDFWSALSFGLSLASKWSAIWAVPIFSILWLRRKNKFKIVTFLSFIILPFGIYLLSYLPMFLTGHDLTIWWGMQKQMWWYHTGLRATHPYTSLWWQWPLLIRPIYLYTSEEINNTVARIYAFGNPFVFWFGLFSIFLGMSYAFFERNKKLALIIFSYLIFFVPWAASPRIMFLYHYLPSIPFLAIATGYVLRRNPKFILPVFFLFLLSFIYFYPHWVGLNIPLWLDISYYWFDSWR